VTELLVVDLRGSGPANERARVPAVKAADLEHVRARARDDMVRFSPQLASRGRSSPSAKSAPIQASFEV
jgi:hypothetical protein